MWKPQVTVPKPVVAKDLAGTYYRGDGIGFILSLTLRESGGFECTWHRCLGLYGSSKGKWTVAEGNRIVPRTMEDEGMMKDHPLGQLDVLEHNAKLILVPSDDNSFFLRYGPSKISCFNRQRAKGELPIPESSDP